MIIKINLQLRLVSILLIFHTVCPLIKITLLFKITIFKCNVRYKIYKIFNYDVFRSLENPYVRLISNSNISATLGTRQELEFVIAIDSDGSKLQQNSVLSLVNFTFDNLINATMLQLTESNEFQHYTYVSPPIDNSSAGLYALMFSKNCNYLHA